MSNTLITLLPLMAMLLAAVSIAALWYWWSSGQEDTSGGEVSPGPIDVQAQETRSSDPTVGDLIGKVTSSAQSWIANVSKAAATPTSGTALTPGYTSAPGSVSIADGEMVEVLRVFRDLADGGLVVEIGGRRYRSVAEIVDPQVKRRFIGNAQALAQFTQAETSPSPQALWSTLPIEAVEQPSTPSWPVPPAQPSVAVPGAPEQPEGPKTIADEIEELIQFRLLSMPSLRSRSIHIRSGLDSGIQVEVDGTYFDSVSDVTEPEILAFLQSVIREWEARS